MAVTSILAFLPLLAWGLPASLADSSSVCVTWTHTDREDVSLWSQALPCPAGATGLVFRPEDLVSGVQVRSASDVSCSAAGTACQLRGLAGVRHSNVCWIPMTCSQTDDSIGQCWSKGKNPSSKLFLEYACLSDTNMVEFSEARALRGRVLALSHTRTGSYHLGDQAWAQWHCTVDSVSCDPRPVHLTALRSPNVPQPDSCDSDKFTTIRVTDLKTSQENWHVPKNKRFSWREVTYNSSVYVSVTVSKCLPAQMAYVILYAVDDSELLVTCNVSSLSSDRKCSPATSSSSTVSVATSSTSRGAGEITPTLPARGKGEETSPGEGNFPVEAVAGGVSVGVGLGILLAAVLYLRKQRCCGDVVAETPYHTYEEIDMKSAPIGPPGSQPAVTDTRVASSARQRDVLFPGIGPLSDVRSAKANPGGSRSQKDVVKSYVNIGDSVRQSDVSNAYMNAGEGGSADDTSKAYVNMGDGDLKTDVSDDYVNLEEGGGTGDVSQNYEGLEAGWRERAGAPGLYQELRPATGAAGSRGAAT